MTLTFSDLVASVVVAARSFTARDAVVVGLMKRSTSRMSGLIDNVLGFARTRSGGGTGIELREESDLGQVIN